MSFYPRKYLILILAVSLLNACSPSVKIKSVSTSEVEFTSKNNEIDSASYLLIAPYKEQMDKIMNEIIGTSDNALTKDLPESSLGNFTADAVLNSTNTKYKPQDNLPADICLLNNGGLRAQLPKGTITRGNIFELMPFENSLVILTISGERTKQLFSSIIAMNGAPFSGARVIATAKKMSSLQIGGKEIDTNRNYKIVTSDYLASGGDKYDFFKDPIRIDTLNYKLRDAIIDYIQEESKKGNTLNAKKDGRIKYE